MPCETLDSEINAIQYVTTQWPATKQLIVKMKLVNMFGDSLFHIIKSVQNKDSDKLELFQTALNELFDKNDPEKVAEFLKSILTCGATKRDGVRITAKNFDEIYNDAGLKEMYLACLFVVKSNYSDFFKGQKAGELMATVEANI